MIEPRLARALGVSREAPPQTIAEYLCRQAERPAIRTLPAGAAEWFVRLAGALGEHLPDRSEFDTRHAETGAAVMPGETVAKSVAEALMAALRRPYAPAVLAAVAPEVIVGGCPARDLEKVCRGLLGRHLETFCLRIVENWAQEGYLRD